MKSKKLTFNMIASKIDHAEEPETITMDDMTIEVKKRLDMKHALQFVQDIVSTCFDEEEATYIPEIFDAAIRIGTLMHYAGFDVPKDAGKAFAVVYETDLFDRILTIIDKKQFEELITGAKRKMAFKRDLLVSTAAQKVLELISKMEDVVGKGAKVMESVNAEEFSSTMKDIAAKLNAQIADANTQDNQETNVIVMPTAHGEGE